jgi:hypothetical protein
MSQIFGLLLTLGLFLCPSAQAGPVKTVSVAAGTTSAVDISYAMFTGSPALSAGLELGGERLRWYGGLDSQPLMIHSVGGVDARPFLALSTGPTMGDEDLRIGPYGSIGLFTLGAGLRVVYSPAVGERGGRHGWEVRGGLHASKTVSASLLYHFRLPPKQP